MASICLYFQAHQPNRLKPYTFFDLGKDHFYEDDRLNGEVLNKVADKCYLPANKLMLDLVNRYDGAFKFAFSLSGVFIEQLESHRPDVLESFKKLAETGHVEFLSETYYHSLSYLYSKKEFKRQVEKHRRKIKEHFNQEPKVFRNTELVYYNEMAAFLQEMGYEGILAEGVSWHLNNRTPNQLYKAPNADQIKVLLKNYKLSDDIAFRFSNTHWEEYPLTAEKYASWLSREPGDIINLFMDYETVGEHHWAETGIFDFWDELPAELMAKGLNFKTPGEVVKGYEIKDTYDVHEPTSWADSERDLSAWNGNNMQKEALDKIYGLEEAIHQSSNKGLIHVWSKMQTSDHFYYMSTKFQNDGAVHDYFSPYNSPYDGYIYFMNVLSDLEICLDMEGIDVYK